jgi:hypothetical protein
MTSHNIEIEAALVLHGLAGVPFSVAREALRRCPGFSLSLRRDGMRLWGLPSLTGSSHCVGSRLLWKLPPNCGYDTAPCDSPSPFFSMPQSAPSGTRPTAGFD